MFINIPYIKDICLWISKFSHHQRFHGSRHWLNFNQSANSWDPARICSMTSYGLMYCVALRLSPCDVTQPATWRPPCGVRRVIQKRIQLYTKKSNVSRNILYGLSMSSSPNLNIHLLWVFFSFKVLSPSRVFWRLNLPGASTDLLGERETCHGGGKPYCFTKSGKTDLHARSTSDIGLFKLWHWH